MNKKNCVGVISEATGVSKNTVSKIIDEAHSIIADLLKKGEPVKISGFGTFYSLKRTSRMGRNPKTGASVKIPTLKVAKFKPSIELKNFLNN